MVRGEWHEGVLGIVAAKLTEAFSLPCIVLSETDEGKLRGSMRTRGNFHCVKILEGAAEILERFGGHQAAAGMRLCSSRWEEFRSVLQTHVTALYDIQSESLEEVLHFDGILDPAESPTVEEVLALRALEPCGAGNPEALFLLPRLPIENFDLLKGVHVKSRRGLGTDMIGFSLASELTRLKELGHTHVDALVIPEINTFRNQARVQYRIRKLRGA